MRIISGKCKGRSIVPPKNLRARPTTDFAKENLFNILTNRYQLDQVTVLDLFAGTGSISFEFASRGAVQVTAVEQNAVHQAFIARTAKELGLEQLKAIKMNAFSYLKTAKEPFDLIFADPPYELEGIDVLPDLIFEKGWLRDEESCFIFEHSKGKDFSAHPHFRETRSYGSVHFSFFRIGE